VKRKIRNLLIGWVVGLGLAAGLGGCGFELDWPGIWDETCYDCRSVCEGTEGQARDDCLAGCSECQGRGTCFAILDGQFDGMTRSMSQWEAVDCDEV
jgi:hypothetical protein